MLLRNLFESANKTAVLGWGRGMGHKGHMLLAKAVIHHAAQIHAEPFFVVSRTSVVDPSTGDIWSDRAKLNRTKDDPLTPDEKLTTYKKVFPDQSHIFSVASEDATKLEQVIAKLVQQGFKNIVLVVGEQETSGLSYLTKPDKSGTSPMQQIGLNDLQIISRQTTKATGSDISKPDYQEGPRATPMRQVLLDPSKSEEEQFAIWRRDMPDNLSDEEVMNLMQTAKARLIKAHTPAVRGKKAVEEQGNYVDMFPQPNIGGSFTNPKLEVGQKVKVNAGHYKGEGDIDEIEGDQAKVWMDSYARSFWFDLSDLSPAHSKSVSEGTNAMSHMAKDLTGKGAPIAQAAAQRDKKREQQSTQSHGRAEGPKWDIAEEEIKNNHWYDAGVKDATRGARPNPRSIQYKLKANHPDEVYFYMQGYKSVKQGVAEGKVINTYLWHGSRQKIPMLEPRQSVDTGGAAGSNQNAIYATSDPKVAIAMGLTTPGSDTGMFPNDPQMVLFSGKIRKGEYVYLHKLPFNGPDGKPQFVQGGNSREFHSIPGVEGIKPIEIKEIPVNKYLNLIRKATPADLKLRKKYMKKQGVAEGSEKQLLKQVKQYCRDAWMSNGKLWVDCDPLQVKKIADLLNTKPMSGSVMGEYAFDLPQGVAEGSDDKAEAYKAHLIKTMPQMMNFLSKKVKGWTPGKEEMLGAIDTAYMVMKHTGDVKQAGKAMMDELNTLHRMSQGQQGVAEARMSAAQRLWNAEQKQRAKSDASLARTPSSIPKPEPKKDEKVAEKIKGADGKACWKGKRYAGTKNGKDICIPVSEDVENIMAALINKIIVNEAISNNQR